LRSTNHRWFRSSEKAGESRPFLPFSPQNLADPPQVFPIC